MGYMGDYSTAVDIIGKLVSDDPTIQLLIGLLFFPIALGIGLLIGIFLRLFIYIKKCVLDKLQTPKEDEEIIK
ncbi:hypothetical protein V7O67_05235 [Methanolobus sp. ZRKC4]|uniref:hypothetical protein n=1 Tax=Methanolobus sp. ZRKC4 TaxID=3125787 RepID=UPI003245E41B